MASLILRIISLFMGRLALVKRESLARHRTAQQRHILTQIGWPDAPESVTGSDWNEWPDQIGIPGRMTPECASIDEPLLSCRHRRDRPRGLNPTGIHLTMAHEALNVMVPAEFDDRDEDRPGSPLPEDTA